MKKIIIILAITLSQISIAGMGNTLVNIGDSCDGMTGATKLTKVGGVFSIVG